MFFTQDLVFKPNSFGELTARIQARNISVRVVAYKMKTTSPDRYKVRPSSGSLGPGQSLAMEVSVSRSHASNTQLIGQCQECTHSVLTSSVSALDKFMLSAVTVLTEDLSAQTIYRLLKQSKPEAQYKLRCIIESNKVIFTSPSLKFKSKTSPPKSKFGLKALK